MSCSCNAPCGCNSIITIPNGNDGSNGNDGNDGIFGGFSGSWIYEEATSVNVNPGRLRFNQTSLSAASQIYINDLNTDNIDYSSFLNSFKNASGGTNHYGRLRIWKRHNPDIFWMGVVTDVIDENTRFTIGINHILSAGTILNNDDLVVSFTPNGISGENGADGNDGESPENGFTSIVHYESTDYTPIGTTGTPVLASYTVPADTLSTNGDTLEIEAYGLSGGSTNVNDDYYVSYGDQGFIADSGEKAIDIPMNSGVSFLLRFRIVRLSDTQCIIQSSTMISYIGNGTSNYPTNSETVLMNSKIHSADSSQANIIQIGVTDDPTSRRSAIRLMTVKHVPYQSL